MKKIIYSGLAILASSLMLTSFTTPEKNQQATSINYTPSTSEEDNVIYITREGYSNPDLWVGKTQPVTWVNTDPTNVHSVTDDYGEFDSGPIKPGESFTISFPHAGVWTYHDEFGSATGMISVMGRDE